MKKKLYFFFLIINFTYSQTDQNELTKIERYIENKNFEQSLISIDQLIQKDSTEYEYYLKKAEILFNLNQYQKAQINFEKAYSLKPNAPLLYEKMSFFHLKLGYYDKAIKETTIGLGLNSLNNNTKNHLLFTRAESYYMTNKIDEAIEDYKIILSNSPIESIETLTFLNIAKSFVKIKKNEEAIYYLENCLKKYPNLILALNNLAFRYSLKEMYSKSMELYTKALNLSLNLPKNTNDELQITEKLIAEKGADKISIALILNNMGFVLHKLNKNEEGLKNVEKSIEIFPENSYAYRNKALILIQLKINNQACDAINKSIELGFVKQYGNEILQLQKDHCK